MTRTVNILLGLLLIVLGAAALVAINLRILPFLPRITVESPCQRAAVPTRPAPVLDAPTMSVPFATSSAPQPSAVSSSSTDAGPLDAEAVDADTADGGAVATKVHFEPGMATAKNLVATVEPVATHLKRNPGLRVVLMGHGDDRARPNEYAEVGRARALVVRRILLDFQIPVARIVIQPSDVSTAQEASGSAAPGDVEIGMEPLREKGNDHAP